MESCCRYSNTIVYNNFPWPTVAPAQAGVQLNEKLDSRLRRMTKLWKLSKRAAQAILDARALYQITLADLYDPLSMPPELVKAHAALDKAVNTAYQYKGGKDDAARVAFLFERYQQLTSLLPAAPVNKSRKCSA